MMFSAKAASGERTSPAERRTAIGSRWGYRTTTSQHLPTLTPKQRGPQNWKLQLVSIAMSPLFQLIEITTEKYSFILTFIASNGQIFCMFSKVF